MGILAFVTSWNTYLLPLIVLSTPSHFTLPLAVAMFQSQYSTDTARVFAYTALSMLPALSIFVFAQRYLVGADRNGYAPRIPELKPVCRCYRPAPLGTRCGAPKAASRRSCWSSV